MMRALEISRVHKAHRKLIDIFFDAIEPVVPGSYGYITITRAAFENAIWEFEHFCRVFGGTR